ncbi:MAG: hypothetical protein Ct9H300mP1_02000 [Planctomycetaceae bacterium]|nr:MAG: hypothetical protein Ct9H300mP1_02000 [Planctomycetaceae bacterium]
MSPTGPPTLHHSGWSRREILQAGTLGLMGLSMSDIDGFAPSRVRSVVPGGHLLFLTGGLAQHESFDPKPNATEKRSGRVHSDFHSHSRLQICEHLPLLADRSDKWALCAASRTAGTSTPRHLPDADRPQPVAPQFQQHAQAVGLPRHHSDGWTHGAGPQRLPGAAVLPYPIKQPGTLAGRMGPRFDPWMLNAASNCKWSGACPNCWDHQRRPEARHTGYPVFRAPNLTSPTASRRAGSTTARAPLGTIERQQQFLDGYATVNSLDRYRTGALSLLTSGRVRRASTSRTRTRKRWTAMVATSSATRC